MYEAPPPLEHPGVQSTPSRRRWVMPAVGATVLALLAGAALAGSVAGWFEGDAEAAGGIAHPVPSNSRALTAAVLKHVPAGVTVVWSSGSNGHPAAESGPAEMLSGTISAEVLMRVGDDQFFLSVVSSPADGDGHGASGFRALADGVITRDKQGRPVSEMIGGDADGGSTLIVESANPQPEVAMPFSDADLKALLADPLVGQQTDTATLARSRSLSSYTTPPPPLTWEP